MTGAANPTKDAVIFVGLPGSGKTSYYNQHFSTTHDHVSRDVQKTSAREKAALRDCIKAGRSFVIDDTNLTRSVRFPYVENAKHAGYRVLCFYFDVPMRTAIARNNNRKDKKPIPVPAILRMAKAIEMPAKDEGFDEIRVIRNG